MSLKVKLMDDLKQSMKNREKLRKDSITMIRSAIKQKEVDERIELDDAAILDIIAKQVKQKRDSINEFKKGNRDDLVEQTQQEIDILIEYLPPQLSEEELEVIVKAAIDEVGASSMKDMGKIMGKVMPQIKGKADGSLVNKIAIKYFK
ncbi:GatB/YqeY domain-containing protein [Clostridium sp. D2Q-11]|uniref:GatB/YqeY domain-containing protein n=1 Tax=Anaeromonas frigoriresistens TaxID=2683708 RepID=A0A942UPM9_9FIRM|nr:GatB/YqeY domain-containing protein [Anaeromonas frigoriresistens]MBS4536883.1 GatB/YqeY domain-containing protein [Anaeromonas frigoriresistens]